jgi:hypothetical protein
MHVPTIYIFPTGHNDTKVAQRIKRFQELGFVPLIDAMHGNDVNWFKKIKAPHRLFVLNDEYYVEPFTTRDMDTSGVDVMICFNEDEDVSCLVWDTICDWVEYNLNGKRGSELLDEKLLEILQVPFVGKVVEDDRKCTDILGEAFVKEEVKDCYGYSEYLIVDKGVKVYEIIKPNVDLPYVTIVENYKDAQDDLDMFSGFFAASSWGVAISDIQFMSQLWKWKMMPGEFNCEEVVKARVDRVVKGGEPEPRVWRNTLQNVIEIVEGGTHMVVGRKRRGDTFLDTVKKNK